MSLLYLHITELGHPLLLEGPQFVDGSLEFLLGLFFFHVNQFRSLQEQSNIYDIAHTGICMSMDTQSLRSVSFFLKFLTTYITNTLTVKVFLTVFHFQLTFFYCNTKLSYYILPILNQTAKIRWEPRVSRNQGYFPVYSIPCRPISSTT